MRRNWRKKYLPDAEVRTVKELLEEGELKFSAANAIPYAGWMEIEFTLSKNATAEMRDKPVQVLILVATDDIRQSIIGFNDTEELTQRNDV